MGCFFHPKVPSVEKVLKALAGLPRSDFAEMIRQVGGVRVQRGGSGTHRQPQLSCSALPLSSQGNGTFNSIPELAVERMAQVIQGEWDGRTKRGHPPWGKSLFGAIGRDTGTIRPSKYGLGPADLRDEMARMTEKVQSIANSFPLPDYTRPVSEALVKAEDRSQPYLREVERFEQYR